MFSLISCRTGVPPSLQEANKITPCLRVVFDLRDKTRQWAGVRSPSPHEGTESVFTYLPLALMNIKFLIYEISSLPSFSVREIKKERPPPQRSRTMREHYSLHIPR
jgi:hypothetical protein